LESGDVMQTDEVAIQTTLSVAEVATAIRAQSERVAHGHDATDTLRFEFSLGGSGGVFLGPAEDLGADWFYCATNPGAGVRLLQALASRFPWRLEAYDDDGLLLASRPALDATA
jgi:hypothetical protein